MRIYADKADFVESLNKVSRFAGGKRASHLPVLSCIRIRAEGDTVHVAATNLSSGIECVFRADVEEDGQIAIPANYLVETIKRLPRDEVTITKEHYSAVIRSGDAEFTLHGEDPESFPKVPEPSIDPIVRVRVSEIQDAVRHVGVAYEREGTRPILMAMRWEVNDGHLIATTTDSHRLAQWQTEMQEAAKDGRWLVHGAEFEALAKALPEDEDMDIYIGDGQVIGTTETTTIFCGVPTGQYPDVSKIIPTSFVSEMTVDRKRFLDALERCHILAKDQQNRLVTMMDVSGELRLEAHSSNIGKANERVPINEKKGDFQRISYNVAFVIDALKTLDDETVTIGLTGPLTPMVIAPVGDRGKIHLVLPVRTN